MTQEAGSWREICEAMANESDPKKMMELAQQLVAALDRRKWASRVSRRPPDLNQAAASSDESSGSG